MAALWPCLLLSLLPLLASGRLLLWVPGVLPIVLVLVLVRVLGTLVPLVLVLLWLLLLLLLALLLERSFSLSMEVTICRLWGVCRGVLREGGRFLHEVGLATLELGVGSQGIAREGTEKHPLVGLQHSPGAGPGRHKHHRAV